MTQKRNREIERQSEKERERETYFPSQLIKGSFNASPELIYTAHCMDALCVTVLSRSEDKDRRNLH